MDSRLRGLLQCGVLYDTKLLLRVSNHLIDTWLYIHAPAIIVSSIWFLTILTKCGSHVCGYSHPTVVRYGYVYLFVYACTSACSCVCLADLTCLVTYLFPLCWNWSKKCFRGDHFRIHDCVWLHGDLKRSITLYESICSKVYAYILSYIYPNLHNSYV